MDYFTIQLAFNYFSIIIQKKKDLGLLRIFVPEQKHLKGKWEVAISFYQKVTEEKLTFTDWKEESL